MSPRRRVAAGEPGLLIAVPARPARPWLLWSTMLLAALVTVGSLATGTFMLVKRIELHRTQVNELAVLDVARSFTTEFLSPDPTGENGANRYVDRMTAQATGEFEKWWKESRNDILIQVARGPEVVATVLALGVERWADDGSAEVLVVAKTSIKGLDGKVVAEPTVRCHETVTKQGDQWKISNFSPVI